MIAEADIPVVRRRAIGSAILATMLAPLAGTGAVRCLFYLGLIATPSRTTVLVGVLFAWLCFFMSGMLARHHISQRFGLLATLLNPDVSFTDKKTALLRSVVGSLLLVMWIHWMWNFVNGTF
jgi:hypothetical protein